MGMGRYVIRVYSPGGIRMNSHHCDGSYDDLLNVATAGISGIGDEAVGSLEIIDTENVDQNVAEMLKNDLEIYANRDPKIMDKDRLDWLDRQVLKSRTGISFDRVPAVEGDPSGIRYMRQGHIGEPCKDVRAAIDRHIRMGRDNT